MATNKPDSRETHVTRIFGTNREGELLSDVWVDVERMDIVKSALQVPPYLQWQGLQRKFRWCDDPNGDDYSPEGTPSRNLETLKVCDPDGQDVDDPDEWVEVRVVKGLRARVETGTQDQGGTAMDRFLASVTAEELTTARVIEVRRIVHHDTNIDDDAETAADAGLKEYVVPSENYSKIAGSKDEDQHVEHEIITYLKHKGNANEVMGLGRQTKLLNEYLIDDSEPPKNDVVGAKGFNPPYRLDPYQNIINVSFGLRVYVVILAQGGSVALTDESDPSVRILARQTVSESLNGTLIECSANAGANFVKLTTTLDADESIRTGAGASVYWFVTPRIAQVRDGWGSIFDINNLDDNNLPKSPFLWASQLFQVGKPAVIPFKIRYAKHLANPAKGQTDKMVQMYPMSGTTSWITNGPQTVTQTGWTLQGYRLGRKGDGASYKVPPEWNTDPALIIGGDTFRNGLSFGKDPPLIAADIPW